MLEVVIAVLLLLVTRLGAFFYQRATMPEHFGDDLAHLSMVKEYQRTRGRKLDLSWLYPLGTFDYPTGFHFIVYKLGFAIKTIEQFGGLIPIIIDVFLISAFGFLLNALDMSMGWWFLCVPFCRLLFDHDGRSIHFSERAFGMLCGTVYLLSMFLFIQQPWNYGLLLTAAAGFVVASVSSKFAIQAMLFFSVLLSVFLSDIHLVVGYLCFSLIAVTVSRGYSWQVLKGLVRHSVFYQRVLLGKHPTIRNHYKDLLGLLKPGQQQSVFLTNALTKIVANNPFNVAVIYCCLNFPLDPWLVFALSGMVLNLVIAVKPLTFLGEAERYLEYSWFASLAAFATYIDNVPNALQVVILVLFAWVFFGHYKGFWGRCQAQRKVQQLMPTLKEWFIDIKGARILAIPMRYGLYVGYDMQPEDGNQILAIHANVGAGKKEQQFESLLGPVYPYPHNQLDSIIEDFGVDYLLVDKAAVGYLHAQIGDYYQRFNQYPIVRESSTFMLVKPDKSIDVVESQEEVGRS